MPIRQTVVGLTAIIGFACLHAFAPIARGQAVEPHAYFESLIARGDVFKAYSLRPRAGAPQTSPYYGHQLDRPRDGGYAACNSCDLWITYDPSWATSGSVQDAARVTIPPFIKHRDNHVLGSPVGADETVLHIPNVTSTYQAPHSIVLDAEIMTVVDPDGSAGPLKSVDYENDRLHVKRGMFGTQPAGHAAGTAIAFSTNTVPNAVRLPLGTTDGNTYFFTWDAYWTGTYLNSGLTNHKAFNFISDGIWLEPGARYKSSMPGFNPQTDVAELNVRAYGAVGGGTSWSLTDGKTMGPIVTDGEPLSPRLARFVIKPNTWTRFWVRIQQQANDYDLMDMWVADENRAAIQIYTRMPLSVRPTSDVPHSIEEFVVEFNTSTDEFVRGNHRDLISYVRNFVALRNPSEFVSLLQRPLSNENVGGKLAPPDNVRLVQ